MYTYIYIYVNTYITINLSCDVTVVSRLSRRMTVFERARIKQQAPEWETANICIYIYIYLLYIYIYY